MGLAYETCLALLNGALQVEIGLGVVPDDGDLKALQQDLYKAREKSKDLKLMEISIHPSPDLKEIWLCRKLTSRLEK